MHHLRRRGTKSVLRNTRWQLLCRAHAAHADRQRRTAHAGTGGRIKGPLLVEREAKVEGGGGAEQRAGGAGKGDGFRLAQTIAARWGGFFNQGASFFRGRSQGDQTRGNDQNTKQTTS